MKNILAPEHARLLNKMVHARLLVAFDFDGTLAPIVAARTTAHLPEKTRLLLKELLALYPSAVISGRSHEELSHLVHGVGFKYLVGNHGLEPGKNLGRFARDAARAKDELSVKLARLEGVEIEDKLYSLSVHYRYAPRPNAARRAAVAAIQSLEEPMRIVTGKYVLNVVPMAAPHKGDALLSLMKLAKADLALYVGDDVTDEDVFELEVPQVISVRVGASKRSAAEWYLRNQAALDTLLKRMLKLARPPAPAGRARAVAKRVLRKLSGGRSRR